MNPLLDRISEDPDICSGRPCIKGTRILVSIILDMLASGESIDSILKHYPQLVAEDIQACIAYGETHTLEMSEWEKRLLDERIEKIASGTAEFKLWSEIKNKYKK